MIFLPRVYQKLIHDFALENERCNIFAGMGLGKTSATYDVFTSLKAFGEVNRGIVFAPKLVAQMSWPDERKKWSESFGHLSVAAAIGTPEQRVAALRQRADLTFINYDNIHWLIDAMGDEWDFDFVAADESTRLKGLRISLQTSKLGREFINGQGSVRAKALAKIAHTKVRRWLNLTGSPAPRGIEDLWGQMFFVDKGLRLGRSFGGFHDRWFESYRSDDGYTSYKPKSHSQVEIQNLIRDVCLTVDARDYFDIQKPIESTRYIELPPKARKHYEEMQKELFTEITRGGFNFEVEALNAGSKFNKLRQIGSGFAFLEGGKEWVDIHDQKVEALRSAIEEANGASVLISYMFKPELARILKAFPKARQLKNQRALRDFQGGSLQIGVAHPASVGHGHSLQDNCWHLCDYSTGWNLEEDEQILERIGPTRQVQNGYKRSVFRTRIVARDTIEQTVVIPRLSTKSTIQEAVKAAMKRPV